jgi:hypothetical protein
LSQLGVKLTSPELLMEKSDLKWKMDEFEQKVGCAAPTLLIEMQNGTECGGVAGVPWPSCGSVVKDPSKVSCIFSLGATPTRFGLVDSENRAITAWSSGFEFGGSDFVDLAVWTNGWGCQSAGQRYYAGPRAP